MNSQRPLWEALRALRGGRVVRSKVILLGLMLAATGTFGVGRLVHRSDNARQAQVVVTALRSRASGLASIPWDAQSGRTTVQVEHDLDAVDVMMLNDLAQLDRLDPGARAAQIRADYLVYSRRVHALLRVVSTGSDARANHFDRTSVRASWRDLDRALQASGRQLSHEADSTIDFTVLASAIVMMSTLGVILVLSWRVNRAEGQRRLAAEAAHAAAELQNDRLREVDQLKDHFVASVSHDLRTPLTSIQGYLELILEDDADPLTHDQRRFLGIVYRNSDRLLQLVGDLLFVAQVDAGMITLVPTEFDFARLCAEAVEGFAPRAETQGVSIALVGEASLAVRADAPRLAQLLDNLLSNALKFTPEGGGIEVRLGTGPGLAVLEVSDTGAGIALEDQADLFTRFFRTDGAIRDAVQGTGLGLSIAKAIVEAHGGNIAVTSAPGEGATFRVELPYPVERATDIVEEAA
jgi:signal transduction histidine kinase